MTPFEFTVGQRVRIKDGVKYADYAIGGCKGTVVSVWPRAGLLNANQFQVRVDPTNPLGAMFLIFNPDQLENDALEELARL